MPPTYHLIDTSPLAARYEVIVQAILGFIAAGQFQWVLRYTDKTTRLIRVLSRLERGNHFLQRKLDMLSDIVRCKRVLGELGGMRRLKTWEIAAYRNLNRIETKSAGQDYAPLELVRLKT